MVRNIVGVSPLVLALIVLGQNRSLKENLDLPYDARAELRSEEDAPEVVQFYAHQYEGLVFFFVLDDSSSMLASDGGISRLEKLKSEVRKALSGLSPRSRFTLTAFSKTVKHWRRKPTEATPEAKSSAEAWVASLKGDQSVTDALAAFREVLPLTKEVKKQPTILFVSDGLPNRPVENAPEVTLREVAERNARHATIHTVWVGAREEKAIQFMKALAQENGGQCSIVCAGE